MSPFELLTRPAIFATGTRSHNLSSDFWEAHLICTTNLTAAQKVHEEVSNHLSELWRTTLQNVQEAHRLPILMLIVIFAGSGAHLL
jgi:hypothetical protein